MTDLGPAGSDAQGRRRTGDLDEQTRARPGPGDVTAPAAGPHVNAGGVEHRAHRHEEQDAECQEHPEQQQDDECSDRSLITEVDEVPDRSGQARQPEAVTDEELDTAGERRRGFEHDLVLLEWDRTELRGLVLRLRGRRRRLLTARSAIGRLVGTDLAVLGLRTGLAVLALLGGDAVPAGLVGLELPAVGTVDRWLAHEHCPQGVFGCTGMCRGLVRLPTRPRGSPRQNSPSP